MVTTVCTGILRGGTPESQGRENLQRRRDAHVQEASRISWKWMSGSALDAGTICREAYVRSTGSRSKECALSTARLQTSRFLLTDDLHRRRQTGSVTNHYNSLLVSSSIPSRLTAELKRSGSAAVAAAGWRMRSRNQRNSSFAMGFVPLREVAFLFVCAPQPSCAVRSMKTLFDCES